MVKPNVLFSNEHKGVDGGGTEKREEEGPTGINITSSNSHFKKKKILKDSENIKQFLQFLYQMKNTAKKLQRKAAT